MHRTHIQRIVYSCYNSRNTTASIYPAWNLFSLEALQRVTGNTNGSCLQTILKLLGLDVCADTIVGDQLLRGISGGQKKRVTSGSYHLL